MTIRAEVVRALVEVESPVELDAVVREHTPTPDELTAAGEVLTDQAVSDLRAVGVLAPETNVYDVDLRVVMALASVWNYVRLYDRPNGPPQTLGSVLKILNQCSRYDVMWLLAWAGLVELDDVPERPDCCQHWPRLTDEDDVPA
jgi:hypothetical protein